MTTRWRKGALSGPRIETNNIWFETLKHFFIDKIFAREKTDVYRLVLGKIVYFESQSNTILNFDESEVSTDVTSELSGVFPLTKLLYVDGDLHKGATISNKNGYSATFIGDSTLAEWPIPDHLQVKSEAQAENIKVSIDFSNMHKTFEVFLDLVKW